MSEVVLCDEKKCTQCLACVTLCPKGCIEMRPVGAGFSIPQINQQECIKCGLCLKSCHQISFLSNTKHIPIATYASWHTNDKIRCSSSSGGVFSAFAEYIINNKGIVFGAAYVDGLDVRHVGIEKVEELYRLRGSKYIQSNLDGCYQKVQMALRSKRYVLFTGTPCQIAGLFHFLKKNYSKLYTCDFVCHGVPSQNSFNLYLKNIGLIKKSESIFQFRYTKGWGIKLSYDGKNIPLKDTYYLKAFVKGYMFMENCYNCNYAAIERVSDVTMADFWGIGDEIPFLHSKRKGVSLLLINTEKGEELVKQCSNNLFLEKRTLGEAIKGNYNLSHASKRPIERETFYEDCTILSKSQLIRKYKLSPSLRDYLSLLKWKIQYFIKK